METKILFIQAITPVHTGTGQSVDVIDLPVAREKTTNWPYIPGSSIKGVLRDSCDDGSEIFKKAFGPNTEHASDYAGSLLFCDGHLLCLPVRSYYGTFAWVTCPSVLLRLNRDLLSISLSPLEAFTQSLGYDKAVTCSTTSIRHDNSGKVYLEDLDLNVVDGNVDNIAQRIAEAIFDDETWRGHFKQRFAVVSDDMFSFLTETCTEVVARIKMDDKQKTVDKKTGGLWYEEAIPAETLLWSPIIASPRNGVTADDMFTLLKNKITGLIQVGGSASVGKGLVRMSLKGVV